MTRRAEGGLIELGGAPYVRVAVGDDDGTAAWVTTSIYAHTTEAERQALADAMHLYPAEYDATMGVATRV